MSPHRQLSLPPHKQPQYRGQNWGMSSTECGRFLPLRHWDSHWRKQVDCLARAGMQVPTSQTAPAPSPAEIPGPNPGSTRRQGDIQGRLGHASTWAHEHSDTHSSLVCRLFQHMDQVTGLSATIHAKGTEPGRGVSLRWLRAPRNLSSGYFPQSLAGLEHSCQRMAQATSDHVENFACCFDADGSQEDGSYVKGLYDCMPF